MTSPSGGIDEVGEHYLELIRNFGVNILYGDAEVDRMLAAVTARATTGFDGSRPQETFVQLHSTYTTNATVYEEYLHVLEGQKRGWKSLPDDKSHLIEEIAVEAAVLAHATELHMTPELIDELTRIRQRYIDELWDKYQTRRS